MASSSALAFGSPAVAYLFKDGASLISGTAAHRMEDAILKNVSSGVFVFQYWPSQVRDTQAAEYNTRQIPGGSHPLYQWISGGERLIGFEAVFTSEIDESRALNGAALTTGVLSIPSSKCSVNVGAAINKLQSYMYPSYGDDGAATPPPRLHLCFPGTRIGRANDEDAILCILKRCDVTQESFYPGGAIRIATVTLEFAEVVQHSEGGTGSQIKFIGAQMGGSFGNLDDYKWASPF